MINSIENDDFYQKMQNEKLTVLDVREKVEFIDGHVPMAQNWPLSELAEKYSKLDTSTSYYVICRSGARSANACAFLQDKGLNVTNVTGGMLAWKSEVI